MVKSRLHHWLPGLLFLCCMACSRRPEPERSFYYWKTSFAPSRPERELLERYPGRLYLRYFDVGYDAASGQALPLSPVQFAVPLPVREVVPVVYIKNNVLTHISPGGTDSLALRVSGLVAQINSRLAVSPPELQVDCDWTAATAAVYFRLLRAIKSRLAQSCALSVTIRLHQVKYPDKTGIPPADKGVLMCYNMGHIGNTTENSIYDRPTAQKYLAALAHYPLPLDLALPIFSWNIQLRQGAVVTLLNKTDERFLSGDSCFRKIRDNRYRAGCSFFKAGFYFREGDELKVEQVTEAELLTLAGDLAAAYRKPVRRIIFYDLDSLNLSRYDQEIFDKVAHRFR